MQEISTTTKSLPQTLEGKTKYVLFGAEALNIYRAKLRAMEKAGISKEQYEQLKMEAQETAENLLLFSADIGKEMQKIEKAKGGASFHESTRDANVKSKNETIHEMGFTDRQARDFQTLANHPEVVNKAIEDARAEDRIVTRSDVLNRIVQPRSPKQIVKDIKNDAHEEHEVFEEKKKEGVVSFEDIQKDREAQAVLTHSAKADITKAIMAISDIQFLKAEDVRKMAASLSKSDTEWLKGALKNSISILTFILHKIGG